MKDRQYWYFITGAKALAIVMLSVPVVPFTFGFAAGFFNSLAAGYVAVGLIGVAGVYAVVATVIKDIRRKHSKRDVE